MVSASHAPRAEDLRKMYTDEAMIAEASRWLTERGDERQRHEERIETLEWAILIFVFLGVIVESASLYRDIFIKH